MLTKIIEFSIRNKLIIGLFTIALVIFGAYETTKLPIDAVPDITNNQVQVITTAPSLGATDIERLVTFPIEQANSNIAGIEEIRSFSRFGLSVVTIVFKDNIDVYWARQQVAERLQIIQNEIPAEIGTPELGPISTGLGEIYQYVLRPEKGYENKYDITQLRTMQDWIVRRQLLGVPGVAEVSSFGGKLKQYEIAVNSNQLHAFNLTFDDVFEALKNNNQNTGGAYIEKGPTVLYIRSEGLIKNEDDLRNIMVKSTPSGTPVFIRDVAEIKIGYATRYGALTYNDEGEVAGAIVMMLKDANSSEVIKSVKERVEIIQKTLPEGVIIEPFLDRTKMVNNAIYTIEKNLAEGALIVIFVLVLFLGNMRAGFLVASVIPLSMLFAIIMMNIFGVSGNLMSLGALDFGLIVDGAVIIVEAVIHQLHRDKKYLTVNKISQSEMNNQVGVSASKMANSAVFGQIIILIVYLPIFTLQGIEGKMFIPMAQTVSFALIGAFILSLTYIPMMSSLVLSKKITHRDTWSDKMMTKVEAIHQRTLRKALCFPKMIIGFVLGLFALAMVVLTHLGGEFIPALEEGDFAVELRVLTGSSLKTSIEYSQKATHVLKSRFPEVEKVVTKIGSGEVPTDPMPMEAADMMVILKDKKYWKSAKTFPELSDKMSKALEDVPGISAGFQYPVQMRFNELMTGAKQDVVCKIYGEDLDSLARYASQLGDIIKTVKGAQDLYVEAVTGMPQVVVHYNRAKIAQYGLNISDINRVVNMAFAGQSTGELYEGEKKFEIVLKLNEDQRSNVNDIRNLLIPTKKGIKVPLYELAEVEVVDGPAQIQREDAKRRIIVGFNVRGRDVQSIVHELQQKADRNLKLSPGYYTTYGGAFENLNKATDRLMIAVPISLALIFLLLFFAFNSIKESLLIYTAIPLSAIGGVFLLAIRGLPFSISAGIGFIALFGVAVLNGIVLIAEFNRIREDEESDLRAIVLKGSKTRLRPVLMTAFVASLGFLPMALSTSSGSEVQRPLATVVIGGLLVATFLTLYVLPILFIVFEKIKLPKMKIGKKTFFLAVLSSSALSSFSQSISLEQAIEIAQKNNLSVKSAELLTAYHTKKKITYLNLPKTNLTTELGQLNGATFDNKFGISQSFSFPTVYASQKQMLELEWSQAVVAQNLNKGELIKALSELYYHILVLKDKEKILSGTAKQYNEYVSKAKLRLDKGASNILELSSAELLNDNLDNELKNLKAALEWAQLSFQLLLNTENKYELQASQIIFPLDSLLSIKDINIHPNIQLAQQELELSKVQQKIKKSKLLPELTLGYTNQSFKDLDHKRYNALEVGISLPLFFGSQRKNIKAEEQKINYAENELANKKAQFRTAFAINLERLKVQQVQIDNFKNKQLPKAKLMLDIANQQFEKGEINYLDRTTINKQAMEIQMNYYEAVEQYNQTAIYLQYLNTKG